ncbi:saccharopine dehydrogenase NADP-binding domain-containing protein [Sinomonas susongensis]|uniref:saccharopine dehydrogenase NADP-binding domain-containing protein n=1 Tax=Sinomonas susongensis TaxID=1324851 RepID=UPI0011093D0C|nr:saccharopine dehydrogenase NADP-binding domain-containing protein [Sinomonas susongensis]
MGNKAWILGGTGRSARAIAAELLHRGIEPTLVGRDAARLADAAGALGGLQTVAAMTTDAMCDEIRRRRPVVVVNTVGPFFDAAVTVGEACLSVGAHYLDLANDVASVLATLRRHDDAVAARSTFVTGAGFGVTATESVALRLSEGMPAPERVRVDMVPSMAVEQGRLGEALAATLVEGLPGVEGGGRFQGRRYRDGRLVADRLAGSPQPLLLPDGSAVTTGGMPLGELVAAQRATGAPNVVAASSEAPTSRIARPALPVGAPLLAIRPFREFLRRRIAAAEVGAHARPREHSWAHATMSWADGTRREGWLRLGDAQQFTGAVPAEAVARLLAGGGRPGAFTPAALFGTGLAEACGGTYLSGSGAGA